MNLPTFYLEELTQTNSFHQMYSLPRYLFDNLSNTNEQKIINLEKSIFILAGIEIANFSLEAHNLDELDLYLQSKLNTQNEYLKLLYEIANINLKFKQKKFQDNLPLLLDNWLSNLKSLTANYSYDDNANIILDFLNTYLNLSKKLNKNINEKILFVYNYLLSFPVSDEAYTVFCDINLLSNFSPVQKEHLIKHFFDSLRNKVNCLAEQEKIEFFVSDRYFMAFFKKALVCCKENQLHNLKHEIASYIIDNSLNSLNLNFKINNLAVLGTLQQLLEFTNFDKSPKEAENVVLLNIIKVSKLVHDDFISKLETFEQPLSHEHKIMMDTEINFYKESPALNSLVRIADSFFNIAKSSYGKTDNEFHPSMFASQILLDDSGLFRGLVNDDKSRYIDKLKQQLSIYLQLIIPAYRVISQKPEFNTTLFTLEMFKSNDDKHIQRALKDFIEEDYYGFVSRSIPLIEKKLRLILRKLGEADIKKNDIGGFDFRPMNAFMSSNTIAETFTSPVQFLFKIIYDDRRGFNLRNKVAHGIIEADEINLFHALMVLFTIVYLSSIEFKPIPIDKL